MKKRYLLDTHIAIWLMFDTGQIKSTTLDILKNQENEVYVSAVSFWEISIKYGGGKLHLNNMQPAELPAVYSAQGFKLLPVSIEETASFYQLTALHHRDPFDRMLIWQAIHNNLVLISNDANMPAYRENGLQLLW